MNKNLEELIDYKNGKYDYLPSKIYHLFNDMIEVLEDFEKKIKVIEAELGIYTEEEIKNIKIGGTNPD